MTLTLKTLATLTLALAVAAPAAAKPAQTGQTSQQVSQKDADTYLFDLLKKPAYRRVWRSQIVPHTANATSPPPCASRTTASATASTSC